MASRQTMKDPVICWNMLANVLSLGHTIPFTYKKGRQNYVLTHSVGWGGYRDESSEKYLLDDIQFALFEENLPKVELRLSGAEDGPICSHWIFTFTREGLVEAYSYYNDD